MFEEGGDVERAAGDGTVIGGEGRGGGGRSRCGGPTHHVDIGGGEADK